MFNLVEMEFNTLAKYVKIQSALLNNNISFTEWRSTHCLSLELRSQAEKVPIMNFYH